MPIIIIILVVYFLFFRKNNNKYSKKVSLINEKANSDEEKNVIKNGIIKSYSIEKGYGYIVDEDGEDYFFDISNIKLQNEEKLIKDGKSVIFTLRQISSNYTQILEIEIEKELKEKTPKYCIDTTKKLNDLIKKNYKKDAINDNRIFDNDSSMFNEDRKHPTTGLPMIGGFDTAGNSL